jgi:hypothetical protein
MNEIQIIQQQLATERLHFAEVANAGVTALGAGSFAARADFVTACADYFAFAVTRLGGNSKAPSPDAAAERWREFLEDFNGQAAKQFATVDELLRRNLPVAEWRALSKIDADSIFTERACYARVKATVP